MLVDVNINNTKGNPAHTKRGEGELKMVKAKAKAKPNMGNTIGLFFGIILLVWVAISTAEVWIANSTEQPYEYCKANIWVLATREIRTCEVTECVACDKYYEVYVTDNKGNEWSYYDDQYMTPSTKLTVTFDGSEIVNAKRSKGGN